MRRTIICMMGLLFFALETKAQDSTGSRMAYKYNNYYDLALSANSRQYLGALSWVHLHSLKKLTRGEKFKIGYGIRFSSQVGTNLDYATAPAILTSKQRGPQVLFSKIFYENVDTFHVGNAQTNLLNISINLQYSLSKKLDVGFNIDAVGFSFGKSATGVYKAYQSSENNSRQVAKPTAFNLLLVSDNDIGSLNSELYARYWFNPKWALRGGVSFLFTEYTSTNKLRLDNDRWRNKALMGMIAISYCPFKK